jgi:hypothetical protein
MDSHERSEQSETGAVTATNLSIFRRSVREEVSDCVVCHAICHGVLVLSIALRDLVARRRQSAVRFNGPTHEAPLSPQASAGGRLGAAQTHRRIVRHRARHQRPKCRGTSNLNATAKRALHGQECQAGQPCTVSSGREAAADRWQRATAIPGPNAASNGVHAPAPRR